MSIQTILPAKDVDVVVNMAPQNTPRRDLNQGLILTTDTAGISLKERCKFFGGSGTTLLNQLIEGGYSSESDTYKCAMGYVSQDENLGANIVGLWIGVYDGENETLSDALIACRGVTNEWYGFSVVQSDLSAADHLALCATVDILEPASRYILTTSDENVKNNTVNNIFTQLKTLGYKRTIPIYTTSKTLGSSFLGYFSGCMTGLNDSAVTFKFKQLIGEFPENLDTGQVNGIEKNHGNVYVQRIKPQFEQGTNANGSWADELNYLDWLVNRIQLSIYDNFYAALKTSQTDNGQNEIATLINSACREGARISYLAPGIWRRKGILNLKRNDMVAEGYLTQWESVDNQSDEDRAARNAQPFYVALTPAGAIHSVLVQINVGL